MWIVVRVGIWRTRDLYLVQLGKDGWARRLLGCMMYWPKEEDHVAVPKSGGDGVDGVIHKIGSSWQMVFRIASTIF